MSTADEIRVIEGSGNVFADLEVVDPEEALIKAEMARAIGAIIRGKHLTQTQAANVLGIDQPKVSALMRGRLSGFSVDRLLRFVLALDRDVEIVIAPKKHQQPHTRVSVIPGS
jgi:predicted XRE-type DNA-binding protein